MIYTWQLEESERHQILYCRTFHCILTLPPVMLHVIAIADPQLFLYSLQEVWYKVCRVLPRNLPQWPSEESQEQSIPLELFHLYGLQQAALHRGGTLHHRREQIRLQRGLCQQYQQPEGGQPQLRWVSLSSAAQLLLFGWRWRDVIWIFLLSLSRWCECKRQVWNG